MKKLICLFVAVIMVFATSAPVFAEGEASLLSNLSEEECLAFLESKGVDIPEKNAYWGGVAKRVITQVEADPDAMFSFGYTRLDGFAEAVRLVVNEYYGVNTATRMLQTRALTYSLQDSTVVGSWSNSYVNYNCYAYAIGLTYTLNPGELSGGTTTESSTIFNIKANVENDLEAQGYGNVLVYTACPSLSTLNVHKLLICFRKDDDEVGDYHFMKYENGSWYHKPGKTNLLKYNYTPSETVPWTNEGVAYGIPLEPTIDYEGDIYYITYELPHTIVYRPYSDTNGVHKHRPICTVCGVYTSAATSCVYKGGSTTCSLCGWSKNAALSSLNIENVLS